jgi:hypothetical protein
MHSSATDGFCQRWMGEKEPHKMVKLFFRRSLIDNAKMWEEKPVGNSTLM